MRELKNNLNYQIVASRSGQIEKLMITKKTTMCAIANRATIPTHIGN